MDKRPSDNQIIGCTTFIWKSQMCLLLNCICIGPRHSPLLKQVFSYDGMLCLDFNLTQEITINMCYLEVTGCVCQLIEVITKVSPIGLDNVLDQVLNAMFIQVQL